MNTDNEILKIYSKDEVEIKDIGKAPAWKMKRIEDYMKEENIEELIKKKEANPKYWLAKFYLNPSWYKRNWAVFAGEKKIFPYTDDDHRLKGYSKDRCKVFIAESCYESTEHYWLCDEIGGRPERYAPNELKLVPTGKNGKGSTWTRMNPSTREHEFYNFEFPLYIIKTEGKTLIPSDHCLNQERYKEYVFVGEKESFLRWELEHKKSSNPEDKIFSKDILTGIILREPIERMNKCGNFVLLELREESHAIFKDEEDDKIYKCNFVGCDRWEREVSFATRAGPTTGNISRNWMLCERVYPHEKIITITEFGSDKK